MSTSEAADQVVRMTLNGVEVAARISGAGAKELAVILYAILSEKKKTKGRTRLESMLRSGKELKVFTVKSKDLKVFTKEAKRYGILYCALRKGKSNPDDLCDIMVRAEDAAKINRIIERFHLVSTDTAAIKNEILRGRSEKETEGASVPQKDEAEKLLEDLFPPQPRENPTQGAPVSVPSERSSIKNNSTKPSVKQRLNTYRREQNKSTKDSTLLHNQSITHHQSSKKKEKAR